MTNAILRDNVPDILIADDTIGTLQFLSKVLIKQGYNVRSVTSGTLALREIRASHPDLVLLDILMLDQSGYEICKELKADPQTQYIPIIFMSALHETFDKVKAFSLGGIDYITKPFQIEEVIGRIQNQIELQSARSQLIQLNVDLEQRVQQRTLQLEHVNQILEDEIRERQQIEDHLRQSEEQFRQLSEHIHEVFWLMDYGRNEQEYNLIYVSPAYEDIWGVSVESVYADPFQWMKGICPEDRLRVENAFIRYASIGQFDEIYRVAHPNGTIRWIRDRGFPIRNEAGTVYRIAGIAEDITAQKQAELERDRFFNLSLDLLFTANHQGELKRINPMWESVLGYTQQELLEQPLRSFVHPDDISLVRSAMRSLRQAQAVNGVEIRLRHKYGHYVWAAWNIVAFPQEQLIYGTGHNISDRKAAEEQLVYETLHDSLTRLDNRASFMQRLELAMKKSRRHSNICFAVLFLDLDGFKGINDTLGHQTGDQLLIHVADTLRKVVRETDAVARLGGDEFTILLEDLQDLKQVIEIVERIQSHLQSPITLEQHEVHTSASIGIVLSSPDIETIADIIRNADIAMYRAKSRGKACYEVFDRTMYAQTLHLVELETHLRQLIPDQELHLYYQPILSLGADAHVGAADQVEPDELLDAGELLTEKGQFKASEKFEGFEVLLRWLHPEKGLISPNEFIPIAESSGLINAIGEWVLNKACSQFSQWRKMWPEFANLYLSLNISGRQLRDASLIQQLDRVLHETGLPPHCLKLEITESSLIKDTLAVADILKTIRNQGIQISLDDFGTGFSSLSYLHQLPIDTLKIDRSFIQSMTRGDRDRTIIQSIINLAHTLDLSVVAEGIETDEQHALLQQMGCDAGQGFLFAKPTSYETLNHYFGTKDQNNLILSSFLTTCPFPMTEGGETPTPNVRPSGDAYFASLIGKR